MYPPKSGGIPEIIKTTVSVSVTDGTDALSGVVVSLTDAEANTYTTSSAGTGSAGNATISDVPEGTYTVTAVKSGYQNYSLSNVTISESSHTITIEMEEE